MKEHSIHLSDGRKLAYAVYGSSQGHPVIYFHGTPSSRLEPGLLNAFDVDVERCLVEAGLQLIAVDRPGMGLSSFHATSTITSVAADVHALIRLLGVNRCSLLSWSGGGPYALAMAARYPTIIEDVYIICSFTRPFNRTVLRKMTNNKFYFLAAKYLPGLLRFSLNRIRGINSDHSTPQWLTSHADVDHTLIKEPAHFKAVTLLTFSEALRVDARGPVHEAGLYFNDYGFDLAHIQQQVHYWWGTVDKVVVRLHAEAVERQIRNSIMHYKTGEGHLSIYVNCFKEVLQTISAANVQVKPQHK